MTPSRTTGRHRRMAAALVLTVLLAATAGPASAAILLAEGGEPGLYSVGDVENLPGARCGYSAENAAGDAFFRWMKFRKPFVYARDTGEGRQQQKIKVIYRLQRDSGTGWSTVASVSQTKTAYDDQPGEFRAKKVYSNGREGDLLRGVVVIQWLRNGSVEAFARLALEHYSVKWPIGVGVPDYQFVGACDGSSD